MSLFGRVEAQAPYLRCPREPAPAAGHRPFQELTGLRGRGKSLALQRALSDFGAERSFERASRQLEEHYGIRLHRSSVREVVLKQAERTGGFVEGEEREAIADYEGQRSHQPGPPWLIVETDGSMVRTGKLEPDLAVGVSVGGRPKRVRRTQWREVRLSLVETLDGGERRYAPAMGPPQRTGEQMFALALQQGYGDDTWVHGVGDGAPWIAQQVASVFPRQRFLLDRYHLLEHLHEGASALWPDDAAAAGAWAGVQASRIDRGKVSDVVVECWNRSWAKVGHPLYRLAGYLENRQGHLDYAAARRDGLPMGSGAVEGGHRSVIQDRLKLPGTWWNEETVNPMLALRSLRANNRWEAFWN